MYKAVWVSIKKSLKHIYPTLVWKNRYEFNRQQNSYDIFILKNTSFSMALMLGVISPTAHENVNRVLVECYNMPFVFLLGKIL